MLDPPSSTPLQIRFGRFGRFELDESAYELRENGAPIAIEPKPLALLIHLARNRHRVVRRQELLETVWRGVTVGGDAIAYAVLKLREALGEVGVRDGSLQTLRGVGFRFVAPSESMEPPARSQDLVELPRPASVPSRLLGRASEFAQLRGALAAALAGGAGRVVFLSGEAGIGKTRLATEGVEAGRNAGGEVHSAFARDGGGAPPFWLWVQILRSYVESWQAEDLRAAMADGASDIARVLPALHEQLGVGPSQVIATDEARFRVLDAVARFLVRAARRRPQVLLCEDLHWADPGSLAMLGHLAAEISRERILIVATARDESIDHGRPLDGALLECARHDVLVRMPLRGLDPASVGHLVEESAGFTPSASHARALHERSGGNPFFVKQILALSAADDSADRPHPETLLAALPPDLRQLASRRLAGLSLATRHALEVAAVIGREFSLALLARSCSVERADLLSALHEAGVARLVIPAAGLNHHFVHDVVREVLYSELSEPARIANHLQVARALEALHSDNLASVIPALAHHYGEAAPLLEETRAVDYAKEAGELARRAVSYEEAAQHFERALRALDLLPAPDARRRAELLTCLGYAHQSAGQLERGRETLREAAAVARTAGDPNTLAMAAIGAAEFGIGVVDPAAVELLEEALRALGDGQGFVHVWLESVLAAHLSTQRERLGDAEAHARHAESTARAIGESRSIVAALASRAAVERIALRERPETRLTWLDEAASLTQGEADASFEVVVQIARLGALLELGDRDRVETAMLHLETVLGRLRSRYWHHFLPSRRAMRLLLDGRFDEAESLARDAYGSADSPLFATPAALASVVGLIRYEQDRLAEFAPLLDPLAKAFPHLAALRAGRVLALLEADREPEARAEFELLAERNFEELVGVESGVYGLTHLANVCARFGDVARARVLVRLLEPHASQWAIVTNGHLCQGPVALYLGMLDCAIRDWDAAEDDLELALANADRMRSPPWRARVLAARAAMHHKRSAPGDAGKARKGVREAGAIARKLGMTRLLRELSAIGR